MSDDTVASRLPSMIDELWAFNETRKLALGNRPIDPEGERALGRLLSDPPEEDQPYQTLDR